jgi:hypothetical protein
MEVDGTILKQVDAGGVLPLLLMVSGYAAMERGSEFIEPRDLVKAIYIVDLEHVSLFWNSWEGFERFIISEKLAEGISQTYINRPLYLLRIELAARENPGCFTGLGKPSQAIRQLVDSARTLASEREGRLGTPSSRDLLFCACSQESELSAGLEQSGLQLEKLATAVRDKRL